MQPAHPQPGQALEPATPNQQRVDPMAEQTPRTEGDGGCTPVVSAAGHSQLLGQI